MARGRPIQKGQILNPGGKPKLQPHLRKFKAKTYEEFIEALQNMGDMTQQELLNIIDVKYNNSLPKKKQAKNIAIIFARFVVECQRGNMIAMKMFFEYVFGKPKELDPNLLDTKNITPQVVITLPDNGR